MITEVRTWSKDALAMGTTGRYPALEWVRPNDIDLAWCAGLYEGEGTVVYGASHKAPLILKIGMSDRDVLILMQHRSGVGHVSGPYAPTGVGQKQWYLWKANGRATILLADAMYPWLGTRRRNQLTEKIELWRIRPLKGPKTTQESRIKIRKARARGLTYIKIAERFNISLSYVQVICTEEVSK